MNIAKISAFASAAEAVEYARELRESGFQVVITGPVDLVLIDKPGTAVGGWVQAGTAWFMVAGSELAITPVD